jgi:hypothetical protein
MPNRRFPPPWSVEPHPGGESFIIRDAKGQALAYVYFEDENGPANVHEAPKPRRSTAHRRHYRDVAGAVTQRRMAAAIIKYATTLVLSAFLPRSRNR